MEKTRRFEIFVVCKIAYIADSDFADLKYIVLAFCRYKRIIFEINLSGTMCRKHM